MARFLLLKFEPHPAPRVSPVDVERKETPMPRGDKSKYTDKQKRKAQHIVESYEARGVPHEEAEGRAWATVNKDDGGGKKPGGSGRARDGTKRSAAERSASARKAAETRKRNAEQHAHP
jgi:hypothetical protein